MAWTNFNLTQNGDAVANGDITVGGVVPNYINVTMKNGVSIKDGWGNTIAAGTTCTIWRKEFTATFTNYDSITAKPSSSILYYGISATDAGITVGTPSKKNTDYVDYGVPFWSPLLTDTITSNTIYSAKYAETHYAILEITSVNASQSINSTDKGIKSSTSGNTTKWRVPVSLGTVSIIFTPKSNWGYDESGGSLTKTYDVSQMNTTTDTQSPTYVYIANPMNTTSLDNDNNCCTGYHKIGSSLRFTYIPKSTVMTATINSKTNSEISTLTSSSAPTIQTTIHLVSQLAFDGSSSSTSNETVTKDVTGYVYRERTKTITTTDTLTQWNLNGVKYSTDVAFQFSPMIPSTFEVVTAQGTPTTTYSEWKYTGGSSFTLPSSFSSRYKLENSSATFTWNLSNAGVHLNSSTGSLISSPYNVTATKTTTYTQNSNNKWYNLSNTSEQYAVGATYTIPTSRVTEGKLITLRLDGNSTITYGTMKSPVATKIATSFTRMVTIYPTVPANAQMSYCGTMIFGGVTLTNSGLTSKHFGTRTGGSWSWKSSSSGKTYAELESVPVDGSTYTAVENNDGSTVNPTYKVPTSNCSCQYGTYVGLSKSNRILPVSNYLVSGTITLDSDKIYYAWYSPVLPPVVSFLGMVEENNYWVAKFEISNNNSSDLYVKGTMILDLTDYGTFNNPINSPILVKANGTTTIGSDTIEYSYTETLTTSNSSSTWTYDVTKYNDEPEVSEYSAEMYFCDKYGNEKSVHTTI